MNRTDRRSAGKALVLAALLGMGAGCGGEDPFVPTDNPDVQPLVGLWRATELVVTSKANPLIAPDLIQEGATFTLNIQPSGQYTAILLFEQQSSTEIGFITVQGQTLTLRRESPPPTTTSTATYSLQGGRLTLDGDTEFDFNLDGEPEPATSHIELTRS